MSEQTVISEENRTAILNNAVQKYVRDGWGVESQTPGQAVVSRKKRIGWFWNLILTLLTGGLWLIVVIVRVVNRKIQRQIILVDQYGNVSTR